MYNFRYLTKNIHTFYPRVVNSTNIMFSSKEKALLNKAHNTVSILIFYIIHILFDSSNIHFLGNIQQYDIYIYIYTHTVGYATTKVFINKSRMVHRTQMLKRTWRNTIGRRSTRVRMMCRAFPLWLERQSSSLLSFVRFSYQFRYVLICAFKQWKYYALYVR